MAIEWDVAITDVQVSSGRANVTFTRTDTDSSAIAAQPQVYSFNNALIATSEQRQDLLDTVKAKVLEREAEDTAIATFVDNLEQTGKDALETWEEQR